MSGFANSEDLALLGDLSFAFWQTGGNFNIFEEKSIKISNEWTWIERILSGEVVTITVNPCKILNL
jgi:hypothetical protein